MLCLLALVFAGDAFSLGHGQYRVTSGDLIDIVRAADAPVLGVDASRAEAPTTTPPTLPIAEAPAWSEPSGPADPPPPPPPPPRPLRAARLDVDFPDPNVVWGGDRWYAFATNSGPRNVQVSASTDLVHWTPPVDAAPTLPPWAVPGYTWAPSVAKIGGQWVMYVSILGVYGGHCLDRLVAVGPGGPYSFVDGGPLVCEETGGNGAIDPSVSIIGGVPYLYWKADGALAQQLFGAALTSDGLALAGPPRHLLTASAAWQRTGIENPSMIAGFGVDWLVYSGAYWATRQYAMGFARCEGPLGPCTEVSSRGPWIGTTGGVSGPGGGDVFVGPFGDLHLAYHSWSGGPGYAAGGHRPLHIEAIDLDANGPSIADRAPTGAMAPLVISPDGVTVSGEAFDPDTNGATDADVYVDGRRVVSLAAHPTFSTTLATPVDGPHRVCVVAVDDLEQSRPTIGCQDFAITSKPFGALVPSPASGVVAGWAIAPSTTGSIAVDVYVDGRYVTSTPANIPRDDVAGLWPAYGAAHGFFASVPIVGPGPHTICAYGIVDDNQPAPRLGCISI
ncbi:MAG: hypothetical protein QOD92_4055 [Acidimicrobiaceae bacterium]|jgi:hypothetical protein